MKEVKYIHGLVPNKIKWCARNADCYRASCSGAENEAMVDGGLQYIYTYIHLAPRVLGAWERRKGSGSPLSIRPETGNLYASMMGT
jgi:hypothetical protein